MHYLRLLREDFFEELLPLLFRVALLREELLLELTRVERELLE